MSCWGLEQLRAVAAGTEAIKWERPDSSNRIREEEERKSIALGVSQWRGNQRKHLSVGGLKILGCWGREHRCSLERCTSSIWTIGGEAEEKRCLKIAAVHGWLFPITLT
jgi:hypothetical protein